MKTPNTEFTKNGRNYRQLERKDMAALYEVTNEDGYRGYEVIRIQTYETFTMFGRTYEAGESYPSSSSWGKEGWTSQTLEDAQRRYGQLCRNEKVTRNHNAIL